MNALSFHLEYGTASHIIFCPIQILIKTVDKLMSLPNSIRRELHEFQVKESQLDRSFYKKINKRYRNSVQGLNSSLIVDKAGAIARGNHIEMISQELVKDKDILASRIKKERGVVFGMIKNKVYCRHVAEKDSSKTGKNMNKMYDDFIRNEYDRRIKKIQSKFGHNLKTQLPKLARY